MAARTCWARRIDSEVKKPWLTYALITTGFWGVWGAFAEFPTRYGFPETLVYVVWALTMIPPAIYAMRRVGWRVQRDRQSILLGSLIGLTGAGGQMLLFHAVHTGPTYLIFPIIGVLFSPCASSDDRSICCCIDHNIDSGSRPPTEPLRSVCCLL